MGPTPEIVMSRRQTSSWRASSASFLSSSTFWRRITFAGFEQRIEAKPEIRIALKQFLHPRGEGAAMHRSDPEPVNLQQSPDRVLDLDDHVHQALPCDQHGAHPLRGSALHIYRPEVSKTHHLSNAAGVVAIGFVGARGKEALRVPRLDAHSRKAAVDQRPVQPFRQGAGFDADQLDIGSMFLKNANQSCGFARALSLPDQRTGFVDQAN
jgi:hypothetical protein